MLLYVMSTAGRWREMQVRIPAMDFDQRSYHGRRSFYLPQFFKENLSLVRFCTSLLDIGQVRLPAPPPGRSRPGSGRRFAISACPAQTFTFRTPLCR
ncbi:hypothetical protein WME94_30625 [Sorangium sp. So ce429]